MIKHKRLTTIVLLFVLAGLWALPGAVLAVSQPEIGTDGPFPVLPNHFIVLVDSSGSMARRLSDKEALAVWVTTGLPKLFSRSRNQPGGRKISPYRPGYDYLSFLRFGIPKDNLSFREQIKTGFVFGKGAGQFERCAQAVRAMAFDSYYTAVTTAVPLALFSVGQTAKYNQLETVSKPLVSNTVMVVVTDDKQNLDGPATNELKHLASAGVADGQWAGDIIAEVRRYYEYDSDLFRVTGFGPVRRNWKVWARVMKPRDPGLSNLVRFPSEIGLTRVANAGTMHVQGSLDLSFQFVDLDPLSRFVPHQLRIRPQGTAVFRSQELSPDLLQKHPNLELKIDLERTPDESSWPAHLDISFIYHYDDPVYGYNAVFFLRGISLKYKPYPMLYPNIFGVTLNDRWLLGTDFIRNNQWVNNFIRNNQWKNNIIRNNHWVKEIFDSKLITVQTIQDYNYRVLLLLAISAAFLFAYIVGHWYVTPKLKVKVREIYQSKKPVTVNFNQRSGEHPLMISSVVVDNVAGKKMWLIKVRPTEFRVRMNVKENPGRSSEILRTNSNLVGLNSSFETSTEQFCATGQEVVALLNTSAIDDYLGEGSDCQLKYKVGVEHLKKRGRILRKIGFKPYKSKGAGTWEIPVKANFVPQDSFIKARIELDPQVEENGLEHRAEESRLPLGTLVIESSATLHCSLPARGLFELCFAVNGEELQQNCGQLVLEEKELNAAGQNLAMLGINQEGVAWLRVEGLAHGAHLRLPLYLDCSKQGNPMDERLPLSVCLREQKIKGDDSFRGFSCEAGFDLVRDSRLSDLRLSVGIPGEPESLCFQPPLPGKLQKKLTDPIYWEKGQGVSWSRLLDLEVVNTAKSGEGMVEVAIGPLVLDGSCEWGNLEFAKGRGQGDLLVWRRAGEGDLAGGKGGRVKVADGEQPLHLELGVNCRVLAEIYNYTADMKLSFRVDYKIVPGSNVLSDSVKPRSGGFSMELVFTLEKDLGPAFLAADVGTSAVAFALDGNIHRVLDTLGDSETPSESLLDLQARYMALGQGTQDLGHRKENFEVGTRFLPSLVFLSTSDLRSDMPGFVDFSKTWLEFYKQPNRLVPFLKTLISQNHTCIPLQKDINYINSAGEPVTGKPPLKDAVVSAYRGLFQDYVYPLLQQQGRQDPLDKMIVAFPNTFTLAHEEYLRELLENRVFPDLKEILMMSESDASALCFLYQEAKLRRTQKGGSTPSHSHLLVYDIGAGTLDLTYLEVSRDPRSLVPQKIEYHAKMGIPVAGNRLDMAIARYVHRKLSKVERKAEKSKEEYEFQYGHSIEGPIAQNEGEPEKHQKSMLKLWKGIVEWKKQYAKNPEAKEINLFLGNDRACLIKINDWNKKSTFYETNDLGIWRDKDTGESRFRYYLKVRVSDLLAEPAVKDWQECVSDWALGEFLRQIAPQGEKIAIDAVMLSGRTLLWPNLKGRVLDVLQQAAKDPEDIFVPKFSANESKAAVVKGLLIYALVWRHQVEFHDRNIWGRYCFVYDAKPGEPELKDLFPSGLKGQIVKHHSKEGRAVYMPSGSGSINIENTPQLRLAYTFAHDPLMTRSTGDGKRQNPLLSEAALIPVGRAMDVRKLFGEGAKEIEFQAQVGRDNRLSLVLKSDQGHRYDWDAESQGAPPTSQAWPLNPVVLGEYK